LKRMQTFHANQQFRGAVQRQASCLT